MNPNLVTLQKLGVEPEPLGPNNEKKLHVPSVFALPLLSDSLPIALPGGTRVTDVHIICSQCDQSLSGDQVRGRAEQVLPHVFEVYAIGYCPGCHLFDVTRFRFTQRRNEVAYMSIIKNGEWQRELLGPPETWLQRLRRRASRWLR